MTTLAGTMLVPGVSGNGRLYTAELIRKAYDRLAERLADGSSLPVTMMTHHAAGDDSTEIVGHLNSVTLNGENLDYTAQLADTVPSKTIENLVKPGNDGRPSLKSVSIRGWWLGPVETKTVGGRQVTTADDLEIDGLDFTKNPGVPGATVGIAAETGATESDGRTLLTETVTAAVQFTETVDQEVTVPTTETVKPTFGDPGYQADKIRRLPTTTRQAAETSWARINDPAVAETYTGPQLKRIKGRIKESLKKHGANMTETTATDRPEIAEHEVRLSDVTECYDCYSDVGTAGFSISAYNGPLTVTVSAYYGIDPKDLAGVAQAAMTAAVDAVHAMDPDDDGDVDTGTTEDRLDDDQMESTTQPKEATVAENDDTKPKAPKATTTETEGTPAATFTQADIDAAVATALKNAGTTESAPEGGTSTEETAPAATPLDEAALRESIKAEVTQDVIKEMRENGTLGRKGLVASKLGENAAPEKPLHEMSDEEFAAYRSRTLESAIDFDK